MPYPHPAAPAAPPSRLSSTSTSLTLPVAEKSPQDYPDIITWCQYLDSHDERNQDGIIFEPFGTILKQKGFFHIIQYNSFQALSKWRTYRIGSGLKLR